MSAEEKKAIVRQSGDAKSVALGPNKVSFLISGADTGGTFSLTEFTAAPPPAPAAPVHVHRDADETLYILEGEFQVTIEDQLVPVGEGSSLFVPKGTPHTIANVGTNTGKMLVIITPPGFEGYWNEMAQLLQNSGGQPPDPAVTDSIREKYHMDMRGQGMRLVK